MRKRCVPGPSSKGQGTRLGRRLIGLNWQTMTLAMFVQLVNFSTGYSYQAHPVSNAAHLCLNVHAQIHTESQGPIQLHAVNQYPKESAKAVA